MADVQTENVVSQEIVTKSDEKMTENDLEETENKTVEPSANGNAVDEKPEQVNEEEVLKSENPVSDEIPSDVQTEEQPMEQAMEPEKTADAEEKKDDEASPKDDTLGTAVAKHYNAIPAGTKEARKDSRIFYLRNFNNWVKSVIINEYLDKIKRKKRTSDDINVLDLACGKGGDLLKWQKGRIDHLILADIAATSVDQCKERFAKLEKENRGGRHSSRDRLFTSEYFAVDCTKERLNPKYKKPEMKLDLTSCQFAFHYSFESYEQVEMMFMNACENLRVGGYFIGTTPDAQKLVKRIKTMNGDSFGNSVYTITPESKDSFPLFGCKYMFHLAGVVNCPEFLVYMPALQKIGAKYNMKLVWKKNFHELFKDYERSYGTLLQKMNAMEVYPAPSDKQLVSDDVTQYTSAKDHLEKKDGKGVLRTLSADEWEAAGLYLAFAFEKMEAPRPSRSVDREDRKRHRDESRESNRCRDRGSRFRGDKRKNESSTQAKRSRRESECDDVYEVKDEIEIEDDSIECEEQKTEKQNGEEQKDKEQNGEEQKDKEQNGEEQKDKDQNGEEQKDKDQIGEEQKDKDQIGEEQKDKDQIGEEQKDKEKNSEEQTVKEGSASEGAQKEESSEVQTPQQESNAETTEVESKSEEQLATADTEAVVASAE